MKSRGGSAMYIPGKMILVGLMVAALWWILEAVIMVVVFHEGNFVGQMFSPDGHELWMRMLTFGILIGFGIYAQATIDRRRRMAEERRILEERLNLAGRLAAVGELAAGVAHELNNPLASVQGYAQFLTSRKDLDEAIIDDVETIYKEAQRASKITGNLLAFARRYEPERRFISINDVIEKSLELHAYRMRVNNIEVSMELAPDLPLTMADFHQMQQVFVNIITNAEQAMSEAHSHGKLSITTQRVDGMIRITFADSGPGISEDNLKKVFDPFFTTKDVGRGTGLGLSICYGLVEGHGGRLYAGSEPGEGATFVVEIPIVAEGMAISDESDRAVIPEAGERQLL